MKKLNSLSRRSVLFGSLISFMNYAHGALLWNSTTDIVGTGITPNGNTFQTQSFTPRGSINSASVHTSDDLANITLNYDGLTVGGVLQTVTGNLEHGGVGGFDDDARIAFQTTAAYTTGQVLTFSFSWATQMVSDKRNTPFGGPGLDSFSDTDSTVPNLGNFPLGDPGETGWANLRNMFRWNTGAAQFSNVTIDIMGDNVGNATNDFYDGFLLTDSLAPFAKINDDHAQSVHTGALVADRFVYFNDSEFSAGDIDNFAIESITYSATLSTDIAAGTPFLFTFDGISNGVEIVPEPSAYGLIFLGMSGLLFARRREG